eukprot:m.345549 g.345549  ORF g.345549 m.345549 type:complete len:328 (-) comp26672_c0_seq1:174-1157(-)
MVFSITFLLPFAVQSVYYNRSSDNVAERNALQRIATTTNYNHWLNNTNWFDDNASFCDWFNIRCTTVNDTNHVSSLFFTGYQFKVNNNMTGTFPEAELVHFPYLSTLAVTLETHLNITSLPSEVSNMENLFYLEIHNNNSTSSTFPASLPQSLRYFYVRNNKITGGIPKYLGDLPKLSNVELFGENCGGEGAGLTGEIPLNLLRATSIVELSLEMNNMSADLSSTVVVSPTLQTLRLSYNNINGSLGTSINASALQELDLRNNSLSKMDPSFCDSLPDKFWQQGACCLGGNQASFKASACAKALKYCDWNSSAPNVNYMIRCKRKIE